MAKDRFNKRRVDARPETVLKAGRREQRGKVYEQTAKMRATEAQDVSEILRLIFDEPSVANDSNHEVIKWADRQHGQTAIPRATATAKICPSPGYAALSTAVSSRKHSTRSYSTPMTPAQLLADPHTRAAKQHLSLAIEEHLKTGESMDSILGLSQVGFSAISARTSHWRRIKGQEVLSLYLDLQQQGYKPRAASDRVFQWITSSKGPVQAEELIRSVIALDYRPKSQAYFYQKLRAIELQIADVLLAEG